MATAKQVKSFISQIAPLIQKYAKRYGYKVASPVIAQACCESAFGTSSEYSGALKAPVRNLGNQ